MLAMNCKQPPIGGIPSPIPAGSLPGRYSPTYRPSDGMRRMGNPSVRISGSSEQLYTLAGLLSIIDNRLTRQTQFIIYPVSYFMNLVFIWPAF